MSFIADLDTNHLTGVIAAAVVIGVLLWFMADTDPTTKAISAALSGIVALVVGILVLLAINHW